MRFYDFHFHYRFQKRTFSPYYFHWCQKWLLACHVATTMEEGISFLRKSQRWVKILKWINDFYKGLAISYLVTSLSSHLMSTNLFVLLCFEFEPPTGGHVRPWSMFLSARRTVGLYTMYTTNSTSNKHMWFGNYFLSWHRRCLLWYFGIFPTNYACPLWTEFKFCTNMVVCSSSCWHLLTKKVGQNQGIDAFVGNVWKLNCVS